jgi:hypothetical protein
MSCMECDLCIEQPPVWEHVAPDGVFVKQMYLRHSGTRVPQHAHVYPHTTMLAVGKLRVWKEGELLGDFVAPAPIYIEAKVKHTLQALEDHTLAYCIHRLHDTPQVEIHAEHQFA